MPIAWLLFLKKFDGFLIDFQWKIDYSKESHPQKKRNFMKYFRKTVTRPILILQNPFSEISEILPFF